jgi:hypothetical protein
MQGYKQFTDLVVTRFRLSERGPGRRYGVGPPPRGRKQRAGL